MALRCLRKGHAPDATQEGIYPSKLQALKTLRRIVPGRGHLVICFSTAPRSEEGGLEFRLDLAFSMYRGRSQHAGLAGHSLFAPDAFDGVGPDLDV